MSKPLTPLGLTVLRMLCDGPMHPYEMQQRIRNHAYDVAVKITHGSLYHSVERLAAAGLIEPLETSREGRRPERTVYAVTSAGRDAARIRLAELLCKLGRGVPAVRHRARVHQPAARGRGGPAAPRLYRSHWRRSSPTSRPRATRS